MQDLFMDLFQENFTVIFIQQALLVPIVKPVIEFCCIIISHLYPMSNQSTKIIPDFREQSKC